MDYELSCVLDLPLAADGPNRQVVVSQQEDSRHMHMIVLCLTSLYFCKGVVQQAVQSTFWEPTKTLCNTNITESCRLQCKIHTNDMESILRAN